MGTQFLSRCRLLCLTICCLNNAVGAATPTLSYEVIARYAHNSDAFTQGFEIVGGTLYESSGLYDRSFIATSALQDQPTPGQPILQQRILQKQSLPSSFFGEGLTIWRDRIYVLTWKEQRGFIFDKTTLRQVGEFNYRGEGWGLAHNRNQLIMSNGSATLTFLNPTTWQNEKALAVSDNKQPVEALNELEWIEMPGAKPRILANIWQTDSIVVIDPDNGNVTAHLDLGQLYPKGQRSRHADVLNGIAFDPRDNTLLITGKFWPAIYRLRLSRPLP